MADGDLWFSPNESTDITAPTAPTDLQSSGITSSTFTLSWTAASDAVGVTAYEVFLDGVSYSIVTSTSANISGRAGNRAYVCTVRARDAAGNWSAATASLSVTTTA